MVHRRAGEGLETLAVAQSRHHHLGLLRNKARDWFYWTPVWVSVIGETCLEGTIIRKGHSYFQKHSLVQRRNREEMWPTLSPTAL